VGRVAGGSQTDGRDFQTRAARIVEGYRDFDAVFERELLPRAELREARRRTAVEFAEEYTQEWEEAAPDDAVAREFQESLVTRAWQAEPVEAGYASYQLIRNVLAAYARDAVFAWCTMNGGRTCARRGSRCWRRCGRRICGCGAR